MGIYFNGIKVFLLYKNNYMQICWKFQFSMQLIDFRNWINQMYTDQLFLIYGWEAGSRDIESWFPCKHVVCVISLEPLYYLYYIIKIAGKVYFNTD